MVELEQILVLLVTILHLRHHNCTSDEKKTLKTKKRTLRTKTCTKQNVCYNKYVLFKTCAYMRKHTKVYYVTM